MIQGADSPARSRSPKNPSTRSSAARVGCPASSTRSLVTTECAVALIPCGFPRDESISTASNGEVHGREPARTPLATASSTVLALPATTSPAA